MVAVRVQDPRVIEAMQRLQPLKVSLEAAAILVFCFRKREVEAEHTFTMMLA